MSQGFRHQRRRKRMRPQVIASGKMATVPRAFRAKIGGGLAEPNGHSASGRGGDA